VLVPGRRQKYAATVVGTDRQTDIGVLRIEPEAPLPAAEIGASDALQVGQWVLAIGNPYGLEGTVSFGIVSAKGRNLETDALLNDFIQTDAMIDRGSSGGPLVDLDGRVVGINSRGQGRGIGFTIPIDTALSVLAQIEGGRIERGWLGITAQPLDRELASYFGAPDATGVVVNSVTLDSPAARAGLSPGDVITALDGRAVEAEKEEDLGGFQRLVAERRPGQEVELRVLRDGNERSLRVQLAAQPKVVPEEAESEAGFHVQEITEQIFRSERLAAREGAFVSFVARGSPAAEAGLQRGDVVLRIGDAPVGDLAGFRRALEQVEGRERFLVTARRGDEVKFLLVKPRAAPPAEREASDSTSAR
jgi:serine protease Do